MKLKKKHPPKAIKPVKPVKLIVKAARPVAIKVIADVLADNEKPKNRLSDDKLIGVIKNALQKAGLKFKPYYAKLSILRQQYNSGRFKEEGRKWGVKPKVQSVRYGDDKKPAQGRSKINWSLVGGDPYQRPSVKLIRELQAQAELARKAGLLPKPEKPGKSKPAEPKPKPKLKVKRANPKAAPKKAADAAPAKLSGKLRLPKRKAKKVGGPLASNASGKKPDRAAVGGNVPPVETFSDRPADDAALSGLGTGTAAGDVQTSSEAAGS